DENRAWLRQVLQDGATRLSEHSRSHYLGAVAAAQIGVRWALHSTPRIQELPLESLSLLYWIRSQGTLAADIGLNIPGKDLARAILIRAITESHCYEDVADAGLILQATETLIERTILASVDETWAAPVNRDAAVALIRRLC